MKIINLQCFSRCQLYVVVLLFIHIHMVVAFNSCPYNCHCNYDNSYRNASCDFGDSTVNMTTRFWDTNLSTSIDCNGTIFTSECENLPKITTIKKSRAEVKVISCHWAILTCIKDTLNTYIGNIPLLSVQDIILDRFKSYEIFFEVSIEKLLVITTDDNMEATSRVFFSIPSVNNYEFVGGKINASNFMGNIYESTWMNLTLCNNSITSLAFEKSYYRMFHTLNIINSNTERITVNMIGGLNTLQSLILKDNKKLRSIEVEAMSKLKNLKHLHIEHSPIEWLPNGMFNQLSHLREVVIENNIENIKLGYKLFVNSLNLKSLKITKSKLYKVPEDMLGFGSSYFSDFETTSFTHLDLADNMIKIIPENLFSNTPSLRNVTLKSNRIIKLPFNLFHKTLHLEYLDLRENYIFESPWLFLIPLEKPLQVLLDHNNIKVLNLDLSKDLKIDLSVTSNQIEGVVSNEKESLRITKLNLSNNSISTFEHWWNNITTLQKLNLSSNNIMTINDTNLYMPFKKQMMEIDLRKNNITNIMFNELFLKVSYHMRAKNRLYLSSNPFNCDCNQTRLLKEMRNRGILVDYKDLICDNNKEFLSHIYTHQVCENKFILFNTIGAFAFAALVILILILSLWARRNKILKFVKNIKNNKRNDLSLQQIRQDESKKYDVFVSYAHEDVQFIANVLLPKLENELNQSVCIHSRDWIVGELIPDQIIKSVESSRKTMIILTEDFLSSDWAMLEFQTAYSLSKQEKSSNIIILVLNETVVRDPQLHDDIRYYVINNGYLWFEDYDFWAKLQKKLPKRRKKLKKREKLNM